MAKFAVNRANTERLASYLCKMRGAALKLGQVLSTMEDTVVPPLVKEALEKARSQADIMPRDQLEKCLAKEYGKDWQKRFKSFEMEPIAAASIGQVHRAELPNGKVVVIKLQYPGVADSIDVDLNNFLLVSNALQLFPKAVFLDTMINTVRRELQDECDYIKEATKQIEYKKFVSFSNDYYVPEVYMDYTTKRALCMEYINGVHIDAIARDENKKYSQDVKQWLAERLYRLILKEVFILRFIQSDPNPANFFYDENTKKLNLIDFGATSHYRKEFIDDYMGIMWGVHNESRDTVRKYCQRIGFLTGDENRATINNHVDLAFSVGEVFTTKGDPLYDFSKQGTTSRLYAILSQIAYTRLTPGPPESVPLDRKLLGVFLQLIRLNAKLPTRRIFEEIHSEYVNINAK